MNNKQPSVNELKNLALLYSNATKEGITPKEVINTINKKIINYINSRVFFPHYPSLPDGPKMIIDHKFIMNKISNEKSVVKGLRNPTLTKNQVNNMIECYRKINKTYHDNKSKDSSSELLNKIYSTLETHHQNCIKNWLQHGKFHKTGSRVRVLAGLIPFFKTDTTWCQSQSDKIFTTLKDLVKNAMAEYKGDYSSINQIEFNF